VQVTYSDISNTAMLVEMARRKGDYLPDLSFGTHFFQDLVEADIRYLPLYPDEPSATFQEDFFHGGENILPQLLPEFATLAEVVHVIDVPQTTGGKVLRVLMNADLDEAVGFLTDARTEAPPALSLKDPATRTSDYHWAWRFEMAEDIAARLDPGRFGVEAMYLIGSVKNATAGPESDIDLLIHVRGTDEQRRALLLWLEAWSLCLEEMNYQKTGVRREGLLDIHLVTDEDIARKTSYAVKIGAVTDAARPLLLGGALPCRS
jgi:pyruvate,water dikinase